jgi:hypothetical protein
VSGVSTGKTENQAAQDQDYVNSTITQRVEAFEQRWEFCSTSTGRLSC